MKWFSGVLELISVICELWFGLPLLLLGYGAACIFIFDRFRINDTDSQIVIAISPFLVLAYFLWKRQNQLSGQLTETKTQIETADKRIVQ